MPNKGFTLLESALVLAMMSLLTLIAVRFSIPQKEERNFFADDYLVKQTEAMAASGRISMSLEDYPVSALAPISFTFLGHVNQAQTLSFAQKNKVKKLIVELGGGRLVFP